MAKLRRSKDGWVLDQARHEFWGSSIESVRRSFLRRSVCAATCNTQTPQIWALETEC